MYHMVQYYVPIGTEKNLFKSACNEAIRQTAIPIDRTCILGRRNNSLRVPWQVHIREQQSTLLDQLRPYAIGDGGDLHSDPEVAPHVRSGLGFSRALDRTAWNVWRSSSAFALLRLHAAHASGNGRSVRGVTFCDVRTVSDDCRDCSCAGAERTLMQRLSASTRADFHICVPNSISHVSQKQRDVGHPILFSLQCLHFHRQHSRKIAHDRIPTISCISRRIHLASRCAEVNSAFIQAVDRHGIAQHVHVAIFLRQALGERLPLVAAGTAPEDA